VGFNRGVDLTVTTSERADALVITAVGEVDVHTAGRLRTAISDGEQAVAAQGRPIIVDLAGVPFMDSTGLGVLVGALARARDGDRRLILAGPTERIVRLLRLTGLDGQFEVASDADSALPGHEAPSGTNQDNSPT
jgi:anti-sigma B factor antagonist